MKLWVEVLGIIFILLAGTVHAEAEDSKLITAKNPQASYKILKNLYNSENVANPSLIRSQKEINIYDCVGGTDYASGRDDLTPLMMRLIYDVSTTQAIFENTDYPIGAWRDRLNKFEADQLKTLSMGARKYSSDAFFRDFTRDMSILRKRNPKLPVVIYDNECGGHGLSIRFTSSPPGAKLFMITRLMKEYCSQIGIDSEDTNKCAEWSQIPANEDNLINGDVFVKAVWKKEFGIRRFLYKNLKDETTYEISPR